MTARSLACVVAIAAAALFSACDRRERTAGSDVAPEPAEGATKTGSSEADAVRGCKAALAEVGELLSKDRASIVRSRCAPLIAEPTCSKAIATLRADPIEEQIVDVVEACTRAHCARLKTPPPLCRAEPGARPFDRALTYEWARFGGALIATERSVPLSWARTVALEMTLDWMPLTAPSGFEPTKRLTAKLTRTGDGSLLVVADEGDATVGRWTFDDDDGDAVEGALDSIEHDVRNAIVHIDADRSADGKILVRLRTSLLLLGARPVSPMQ